MGYERVKTESSGSRGPRSGSARWMTRAEAKQAARRERRRQDRGAADAGLGDANAARLPHFLPHSSP